MGAQVTRLGKPAAPVALATATLFDSTADLAKGTTLTRRRAWQDIVRAITSVYVNQAMTFKYETLERDSTTWRTVNGGGSGEVVAANTLFERDVEIDGEDFRFTLTAGAVAPTTWEVATKLIAGDRSAGT